MGAAVGEVEGGYRERRAGGIVVNGRGRRGDAGRELFAFAEQRTVDSGTVSRQEENEGEGDGEESTKQ